MLKISIRLPYAGGGRTLPCTRNFFEKKLSKSFFSAAAGNGCFYPPFCLLPRPPKGLRAGWGFAVFFLIL